MELSERIRSYLDACPGAVSGQKGHTQTFLVACRLFNGFGLSEDETLSWLQVYNQKCQPPWNERELRHKASQAAAAKHPQSRGHFLTANGQWRGDDTGVPPEPRPNVVRSALRPVRPEAHDVVPAALISPTIDFLASVFDRGEGVSVCEVVKYEEGRTGPKGSGQVIERDALIALLEKHNGDPNTVFHWPLGGYVRINPMELEGKSDSDADVTAWRHCLIEFDRGTIAQQWETVLQSGAPCSAVLTSGGRSLHAWVRVDATDRKEFDQRRDRVFEYFAQFGGADSQNKNPSRFSRLPGMLREGKPQELLSFRLGAPSYEQWLIDLAASSIGRHVSIDSLLAFVPDEDKNCLIGNRWLCRGGSLVLVGQTHAGKSSLGLQMAVFFALGIPFFGIKPPRKLKSVYLQAENDDGDMAEMIQGILLGAGIMGDDNEYNKLILNDLRENLIIVQDQSHVGLEFARASEKLAAKHQPDFFWADPFLSYYGDDINDQKACSTFLRSWLNPISTATGLCWVFLHHTAKPPRDGGKGTKHFTSLDYAYMGLGSSELSNWARAIIYLQKTDEDEFRMILAKRGYRAGLKETDGSPTNQIYIAHSSDHICWKQIPKPDNSKNEDACNKFVSSLGSEVAGMLARDIVKRAEIYLKRGSRTVWKLWDKGSGPLGSLFVRDFATGLFKPL